MYDFLLVLCSKVTYAVYCTVYEKFDVEQSIDLEISPRSLTLTSREGYCVAMYVQESSANANVKRATAVPI